MTTIQKEEKIKMIRKKALKVAPLSLMLLLPNLAFAAAGWESAFENIELFIKTALDFLPLVLKLLIWLFAVACIVIAPVASYFLALSFFKKKDERNDSDTSSATTHAKAAGVAVLGLLMGMFLFQLAAIYGMGLDESIGGGYGKVLATVLMLKY